MMKSKRRRILDWPTPLRCLRNTAHHILNACRLVRAGVKLSSLLLFPARQCFPRARKQLDLRRGIRIISPPEEDLIQIFIEVWIKKCYVPGVARITPAGTIVDIGAHVGVFTLWAATQNPDARVIALEPSTKMCEALRRNVAVNDLRNVEIVQAACGGLSGYATLYSRGLEWGNSLYCRDLFGSEFRPIHNTPVVTLDELFQKFQVLHCDLMKLNCEGAEYEVLFNACGETLERINRLSVQYHIGLTDHSPDELSAFLRSHGFAVECLPLHSEEGGFLYAHRPGAELTAGGRAEF